MKSHIYRSTICVGFEIVHFLFGKHTNFLLASKQNKPSQELGVHRELQPIHLRQVLLSEQLIVHGPTDIESAELHICLSS